MTSPGYRPPSHCSSAGVRRPSRSTVGTVTTLSNLLRMLFSRAGTYPRGATERLDSDAFSPNTAVGACPECHGLGRIHRVTEETLVPEPSLTIREGAVAAWPGAWQGQNLRDILVTLGYDIDKPWRKLPKRQRNWILFTDEQPTVEIDPRQHPVQADYYYNGTFSSAERHVRHTLANSHSAMMRRRVLQFVDSVECPVCNGSGLRPEALKVTFAGRTIADYAAMPLADLVNTLAPHRFSDRCRRSVRVHEVRRADGSGDHDRRRPRRTPADTHRSRPWLSHTQSSHSDGVTRRTAAVAAGHSTACRLVRRALCAR